MGKETAVPIIHADLHGNAPDKSGAALLLIDFINDLEFDEGEAVLKAALLAAREVLALKQRARNSEIPVIYVNDNFGRWRSDFAAQVRHCLEDNVRGRPITELLKPDGNSMTRPVRCNFLRKPPAERLFSVATTWSRVSGRPFRTTAITICSAFI